MVVDAFGTVVVAPRTVVDVDAPGTVVVEDVGTDVVDVPLLNA